MIRFRNAFNRCLTSGRCINTLRGHRGRVLCLHVSQISGEKTLLSGSSDKTIKVTFGWIKHILKPRFTFLSNKSPMLFQSFLNSN